MVGGAVSIRSRAEREGWNFIRNISLQVCYVTILKKKIKFSKKISIHRVIGKLLSA